MERKRLTEVRELNLVILTQSDLSKYKIANADKKKPQGSRRNLQSMVT